MLSGGAGIFGSLPPSIRQALAIDPALGSTYLDAEHIVILMQENRSFDHCYGSLQGVRGFNDPRAIRLPNDDLVWLQRNAAGEAFVPFRLNMKDTKATFLGSLPHSWTNQVDAGNGGKSDQWVIAKPSGHTGFENTPLTMGYYNRQDIPFYYSLADAFTVCDQNFSSSLTGTTPNRLYLWTGTIREEQHAGSQANVTNSDVDYDKEAKWTSFPERLEDNNISWKIYQNELSIESGLDDDEDAWLANFTDNPIEWFTKFNVRFSVMHQRYLEKMEKQLPAEIEAVKTKLQSTDATSDEGKKLQRQLESKQALLARALDRHQFSKEKFNKLSQREKNLHTKAFTTNSKDPDYRKLATFKYTDEGVQREMKVPKGDVLYQFRQDVNTGKLPTVSWVVGSANFSDHPGSPWYGAWYVSEVMDILTKKPEVWKKTIFILCYDENDGYFDHVPPFTAPDPGKKDAGLVSKGIDTSIDFVTLQQDLRRTKGKEKDARESAIGLGYRVPLVIASPWSRGGVVCSQVFDHTSVLQFMEKFLSHKTGKPVKETNISEWRRTVCGDLTAVFRPYNGEKIKMPSFVTKDSVYKSINSAQYKKDPSGFKVLTTQEINEVNKQAHASSVLPQQEKGTRTAAALPYQLYAEGKLDASKGEFKIRFTAATDFFGDQSAGSPFNVYANTGKGMTIRNYAVKPGDSLEDSWVLDRTKPYAIKVNGPNGFYREFNGQLIEDPALDIRVEYSRKEADAGQPDGNLQITIKNRNQLISTSVEIKDNAYGNPTIKKQLADADKANEGLIISFDLEKSAGWYDFTIKVPGLDKFARRYAGHVETGKPSTTDPAMGNV